MRIGGGGAARAVALVGGLWLAGSPSAAEVVYLRNGDVLHGTVTRATTSQLTLETPYGRLVIPKKDIVRIDYEEASAPAEPEEAATGRPAPPAPDRLATGRSVLALEIRGRSFWWAFHSPPDDPADLRIRLRLAVGEALAAVLLDSKPDTVDKNTYYNSFTFSPTDSAVVATGEGFDCAVEEAGDGRVLLRLVLPPGQGSGQVLVRMIYEINEGSPELPRWREVVARSFTVPVEKGRRTSVVLRQDAGALDYGGFLRKSMKNVESFAVSVLSAVVEDESRR